VIFMKTLFVFDRPLYPLRGGAESRALDHIDYLESRNIRYDLFLIDRYYNYNRWDELGIEFILNRKVDNVFLHQVLDNSSFDTIYHKMVSKFYAYINQEAGVGSLIHSLPCMRRKFKKVINNNKYDFIFFNHVYVSHALVSDIVVPCKIYIDTHDIYSNLVQEVLNLQNLDLRINYSGSRKILNRTKVRNFDYGLSLAQEFKALRQFDKVITISNEELEILKQDEKLSGKSFLIPKISSVNKMLIPNNSDTEDIDIESQNPQNRKFKLLFFGSQYDPNIHGITQFYYNVIPKLNSQVEIIIAGGVSLKFANKNHPQLKVLGFVDDISKLYASVDAVIIPIFYGSGVSIKAVEALSYGKPVISTPKGVRGLSLEYDRDVLIAKDIDDFPSLIEKLRLSPNLCQSLSKYALKYIETEHSKASVYSTMDSIFLS